MHLAFNSSSHLLVWGKISFSPLIFFQIKLLRIHKVGSLVWGDFLFTPPPPLSAFKKNTHTHPLSYLPLEVTTELSVTDPSVPGCFVRPSGNF